MRCSVVAISTALSIRDYFMEKVVADGGDVELLAACGMAAIHSSASREWLYSVCVRNGCTATVAAHGVDLIGVDQWPGDGSWDEAVFIGLLSSQEIRESREGGGSNDR